MSQAESKNPVLSGSDIIFECGQCGKSLSIDFRGAGLNVRCPQCDSDLEVPIPEGFDLAELDKAISDSIDSVASDKEVKISMPGSGATAAVSSEAAEQINALKAELESLRAQQQDIAPKNADILRAIRTVDKQIDELHKALDGLAGMLGAQTRPYADETQKIG